MAEQNFGSRAAYNDHAARMFDHTQGGGMRLRRINLPFHIWVKIKVIGNISTHLPTGSMYEIESFQIDARDLVIAQMSVPYDSRGVNVTAEQEAAIKADHEFWWDGRKIDERHTGCDLELPDGAIIWVAVKRPEADQVEVEGSRYLWLEVSQEERDAYEALWGRTFPRAGGGGGAESDEEDDDGEGGGWSE